MKIWKSQAWGFRGRAVNKVKQKGKHGEGQVGAGDGIRTHDVLLGKQVHEDSCPLASRWLCCKAGPHTPEIVRQVLHQGYCPFGCTLPFSLNLFIIVCWNSIYPKQARLQYVFNTGSITHLLRNLFLRRRPAYRYQQQCQTWKVGTRTFIVKDPSLWLTYSVDVSSKPSLLYPS